ncbi:LysR family transcriptional regulator [Lutibaculum baratangense]|uniref:Hydrogen peroxide-inducible activator n=1 Tax=Lutibaculum baratangense AMV1 TaxID=631454 RepID=V4RG64_9HYPH|nr:LysR family transcriptional regulator [Lutibaculum baratangense]ESR24354.1 Hydrogen peroxide-inducible activator [Lutibaculum baratangense AMV1]
MILRLTPPAIKASPSAKMDIRQLQYLAALAREKHFTRAAAACHVTQPTLSGRIRQLEQELGVSIVKRGQRFEGLTPEGQRVLKWAHSILENCSALEQELAALKGELAGRAVLGVIPSALPTVSVLTNAVRERFPLITFQVLSQTSREILRNISDFSIDAGVSYLDNEPIGRAIRVPLYKERYRLFVRDDHPLAERAQVEWAEAAIHPLGLLSPDMQNRRIVDAIFARLGRAPEPEIESNSVVSLYSHIRLHGLACILPEHFLLVFDRADRIRTVPLVEPQAEYSVGIVAYDRDPPPPVVASLLETARTFELPEPFAQRLA